MARIIFPAGSAGEAKAYIKALTGASTVTIPAAPGAGALGEVLVVESKFLSVAASANLGFGFGDVGGGADVKILLQDYWFQAEIDGGMTEVNSWTFAAGFRVGIRIVAFKASLNVSLGVLAAKAQSEGLNVQLQVLRVGMPKGPNVPANLAMPVSLDVDKFGDLKAWQGSIIKYAEEHHNELTPMLVSASVNISGERLLNSAPGVRYAMWRIEDGQSLKEAIAYINAGKVPGVGEGETRAVYAAVFNDPTMHIPGQASEVREPGAGEKKAAREWLTGYESI